MGLGLIVNRSRLQLDNDSLIPGVVEMRVDGVDYTYAQFQALKSIEHPESGTLISHNDSAQYDLGRAERDVEAFAAETFRDITFTAPFKDASLMIKLQPHLDAGCWPSNITASGFRINASASITGDVGWEATKI